MKKRHLSLRRTVKQLTALLVMAVLPLVYNNCSGFNTLSLESGSSNSSSTQGSMRELPSFTLTSPVAQAAAPFVVGHAFRKGDVPAGTDIQINGAQAQATVKNRWPDGSVKFAIIAGLAPLAADSSLKLSLSRGTALSGAAITVEDLRAAHITAAIDVGTFGSASWADADWSQPFQNWISGPLMSSFVYRKAIGSDPHLTAWLEVRIFKGGAIDVLPWVENGYLKVPSPTDKNATYSFTLNGQQKMSLPIDLLHHTRTPLINGTALSYWVDTDPQVTPHHDVAYFQATELVPTYSAVVDPANITISAPSYVPLQAGGFVYDSDSMPSTGYQRPIGLLPEHDMLYFVCTSPRAVYESIVRNGYSAGRYPIHYRDETTQRPLRFSSYPTMVIMDGCAFKDSGASNGDYTPACNGPAHTWDPAHSPSVGYMAYLITGRWYFMEETQFAATTNFLGLTSTDVIRHGSTGIFHPVPGAFQTRSAAWTLRALAQTLTVTPDDDTVLRDEFRKSWESNVSFYHSMYIEQPNNPFGFIQSAEGYGPTGGMNVISPWQQDFVTAVWGYAVSLDLPVSPAIAQQTAEFFQWKAKSIVGRLGTADGFWYVNAAPYTVEISSASVPDWAHGTGPWYADWSAVYKATYRNPPSWMSATEGTLAAEYTIDSWGRSMWGNLQPAISYAVRHHVPGADEAYARMIYATNWPALSEYFKYAPVWSVKPAQ